MHKTEGNMNELNREDIATLLSSENGFYFERYLNSRVSNGVHYFHPNQLCLIYLFIFLGDHFCSNVLPKAVLPK